jgi:membrane protease YdiL (CAAX protease family)
LVALPPPIIIPESEEVRPKNPFIWLALYAAFLLLIFVALSGYLHTPNKTSEVLEQIQGKMREKALSNTVQDFIHGQEGNLLPDQKAVLQLEPQHNKDTFSDKLFLAAKIGSGDKVSAQDAKLLIASKDPADNAFAEIYTSKSLTLQKAQQLSDALPKEQFVDQVARIQALQKAGAKGAYLKVVGQQRATIYLVGVVFSFLAIGGGLALWIGYFAARGSGKLLPLGHPSDPMQEPWPERYAVRALQLLLGFVSIGVGVAFLFRGSKDRFAFELVETLLTVASVPFFYFIPIYGKRISAKHQGWRSENLGKNILWGLAAAVANAPLLIILGIVGEVVFSWLPNKAHPIALELENHRSLLTFVIVTISASIGAPIFEETLFRGTLLPALTNKYGSMVWGILVSSFFFAALHPTGPPAWFPLAGIGAVSALLTYQTKSLVPSVVMHAAHNLAMVLLALAFT